MKITTHQHIPGNHIPQNIDGRPTNTAPISDIFSRKNSSSYQIVNPVII